MDGDNRGYLKTVCDYVHLNLARAKLLRPQQPLREYRWSSWPEYVKRPGRRWPWLRVDRILGGYGIPKDSAAGRRYLERALGERRAAEAGTDYRNLRRGGVGGKIVPVRTAGADEGETVMTVQWIAQRLQMGAPGYVHHLLYCQRKAAGGAYAKIKN